jgi:hypothetical protein
VYFIVEAGLATESPDFYFINGYSNYQLKRARQVASGIMVGIRNGLMAKYQVLHEANDEDSLEAVLINIWKSKKHFSIVNLYNPPTNLPSLQCVVATLQPHSRRF